MWFTAQCVTMLNTKNNSFLFYISNIQCPKVGTLFPIRIRISISCSTQTWTLTFGGLLLSSFQSTSLRNAWHIGTVWYLTPELRLLKTVRRMDCTDMTPVKILITVKVEAFWTCFLNKYLNTRVYPKVSGLAAWSTNCKW